MPSPDACVAEDCQSPFISDASQRLGANAPDVMRAQAGAILSEHLLFSLLLATAFGGGGIPPSPPSSAPAGPRQSLAGLWRKLEGLLQEARSCLVAGHGVGEDATPAPPRPRPAGSDAGEAPAPPPEPQLPPTARLQPGRNYATAAAARG